MYIKPSIVFGISSISQSFSNISRYEASGRPLTKELLAHPIFWTKAKTLQFLQDVSDRIENLDPADGILVELEQKSNSVLKNNWKSHICQQLSAGGSIGIY